MTYVYPSKTLSITVESPPKEVYEYIFAVVHFPEWAPCFCKSIRQSGDDWLVEAPEGLVKVRFVERNEFGVLDHSVKLESGQEMMIPLRVIPNGRGSEVVFTLYQQPGVTDDMFAKDAGMVESDLRNLKTVLEGAGKKRL
ncbi:hypothetical protein ACFQI7_18285 [Paenibacillus allorhizosphaerae]|uniref:SRPBCC family protein n=1 Tax=Paenibacillus allorhizosphaerae TaxID=2849866 RepID=A0ABM8VF15_9BACL|nr:hypothetical protein [Paenibacillus allorhizosphaerae]CAG7633369.1 hypothetical protein PAECIP111802_01939 [Paenibacillus allorhizosphaerae]